MDVLRSMLFKEVLKAAGSAALMSRGLVSALNVRSLILLSLGDVDFAGHNGDVRGMVILVCGLGD